jgi:hypothetical protein
MTKLRKGSAIHVQGSWIVPELSTKLTNSHTQTDV